MSSTISLKSLRNHFAYNWWKYLLIAVIGWFSVDMLYNATAYRVPDNRRIDFYVYGYTREPALSEYTDRIRTTYLPDVEEIQLVTMMADDTYGPMQLVTYMAAAEGDLYLLPREEFLNLSAGGAFIPLEGHEDLMSVLTGTDLQRGWRKNAQTGETHLYGIPQKALPGLDQYMYTSDMNGFICVMIGSGNEQNTLEFLEILCQDMLVPPPEEDAPSPSSIDE